MTGHDVSVALDDLAVRLRAAFNSRDIDAVRSLLAERATWGEDPDSESFCHDRDDVIRHLEQLLADGVRPTIVETRTGASGIAARLSVEWPDPADERADRTTVHQSYVVSGSSPRSMATTTLRPPSPPSRGEVRERTAGARLVRDGHAGAL
jgi:hypothetical protein